MDNGQRTTPQTNKPRKSLMLYHMQGSFFIVTYSLPTATRIIHKDPTLLFLGMSGTMNNYIVVIVAERDVAQGTEIVAVVEDTPRSEEETCCSLSNLKKCVAVECVALLLVVIIVAAIVLLRSGGDGDEEPAIPTVPPTVAPI
jgi:hypothetical protein